MDTLKDSLNYYVKKIIMCDHKFSNEIEFKKYYHTCENNLNNSINDILCILFNTTSLSVQQINLILNEIDQYLCQDVKNNFSSVAHVAHVARVINTHIIALKKYNDDKKHDVDKSDEKITNSIIELYNYFKFIKFCDELTKKIFNGCDKKYCILDHDGESESDSNSKSESDSCVCIDRDLQINIFKEFTKHKFSVKGEYYLWWQNCDYRYEKINGIYTRVNDEIIIERLKMKFPNSKFVIYNKYSVVKLCFIPSGTKYAKFFNLVKKFLNSFMSVREESYVCSSFGL